MVRNLLRRANQTGLKSGQEKLLSVGFVQMHRQSRRADRNVRRSKRGKLLLTPHLAMQQPAVKRPCIGRPSKQRTPTSSDSSRHPRSHRPRRSLRDSVSLFSSGDGWLQ